MPSLKLYKDFKLTPCTPAGWAVLPPKGGKPVAREMTLKAAKARVDYLLKG